MVWIVILSATYIQNVSPSYTGYLSTSLAGIMRDIATEHQIFLAPTDNNTPELPHVVMMDGYTECNIYKSNTAKYWIHLNHLVGIMRGIEQS